MRNSTVAELVLRAGIAFAFLYPPISALSSPESWIGYFPAFMHGYVPDMVLLHGFGLLEAMIAVWILSGWRIFWPSLAAALILFAIVLLDYSEFEVIFRDISIAAAALSLALMSYPKHENTSPQIL